jgi:hypothetical protein
MRIPGGKLEIGRHSGMHSIPLPGDGFVVVVIGPRGNCLFDASFVLRSSLLYLFICAM